MYRKQGILVPIVILSMVVMMLVVAVPTMAQSSTSTPAPSQQPAASPQPTNPPMTASTQFFATSNFRVNVRSGPGTQYTVIGQARVGDALDITGRLANNQWLRVNFNGQEGWISAALFDVTGDVATAPEATAGPNAVLRQTAAQSNASQSGNVTVVTRVNTNLRSTPSIDGNVLATIPFNTQLTVTGRSADSNWVQVSFNNQTGWISSGLVTFQSGNLTNVNQFDASGNPVQPTQAAADQAQPTSQPMAQPTAKPTSTPTS